MRESSQTRKHFRLGVFMPVGNNGWIMSKNAPQYPPTFQLNKDVALKAEEIGFDYVFSMAKWSGYGGATQFWESTIESFNLMSALAAVTTRLRLVASISPVLVHPTVVAKMAVTFDDISGGRAGINIVSSDSEYWRMGLYPEDFYSYHHAYNTEWLEVMKRLWTGERVEFHGKYFDLTGYTSNPRPVQQPWPTIVYATSSEPGYQFVAEHCDEAFLSFRDPKRNETSRKVKDLAREHGRSVKTQSNCCLIHGSTDEEAERMLAHLRAGADLEAIANVYGRTGEYSKGGVDADWSPEERRARGQEVLDQRPSALFYGSSFVGGPERIADMIEDMATNGDMDGLLLNFPDFVEGLEKFNDEVMPLLKQRGLRD
jgi:pyrimidine oxygenase